MLRSRLFALAAAALFSLSACSKDDAPAGAEATGNDLLDHVPTGTPYLSANLRPMPDEVIDRFLQRAQPLLQTMQANLVEARARLEADPAAADTGGRVVLALLQELDGKLSRAGLESLGLDLQASRAFYGMGAFPVYRMGLFDADSLRATVQRILDKSGVSAPRLEHQGRSYWKVPIHGDAASEPAAALYVAILDDQLTAGLLPTRLEDEMLSHLLGLSMPPASDAVARLTAINERFGYTPYGTGEIDLLRMADELMSDDSLSGRALFGGDLERSAHLDEQCRAEIRQILSRAPRVYSGLSELTPDVVAYGLVLETELLLAEELAALVSAVPAADSLSARAMEFALGLKVGAVRDFLREKAGSIAANPYECRHLAKLNDSAKQAYAQLNQPIPPLVNNFQGMRVSLSAVGSGPANPEEIRGVLAIHVEQPEMFVGMAQMFLPDLAALDLVKGGPPVELPASMIPISNVAAFAALGDNAIGLSVGAGEEARLPDFLAEKSGPTGTFLSVNYDTALYLDYSNRLADSMAALDDGAGPGGSAVHDIAAAARDAYKAMAGRTDTRLSFTADGMVIESRMTFK